MPAKPSARESAVVTRQTTPIPPGIAVPEAVRTRLCTLRFSGGFADDATVRTLFDDLDLQRAVQAYRPGIAPGDGRNWIQTLRGKRWFAISRLHGPLEAWFDKSWRLPDIVPVS